MGLNLRMMYVKPGAGSRVWDVILLDERQNARVFIDPAGTEFIDVVIMGGEHYHPQTKTLPVKQLTTSQRRKKLKRARHKGQKAK